MTQLGLIEISRRQILKSALAAATTRSKCIRPLQAKSNSPSPSLYIYPNISRYLNKHTLYSVQTVTTSQTTTDTPTLPALAGVVVLVAWSDVEALEGRYDFSMIDAIIDYWGKRGKRIILDVATIGYPFVGANGQAIQTVTPDWLLKRAGNYSYPSQVLGFPTLGKRPNVFPDFRDPVFVATVGRLAQAMRRYDGNRVIAQLRMPLGLMGEDNPLVGPVARPLPWYSESLWLSYCHQVIDIFANAFHRTQLEFDIGRLGAMWAHGSVGDGAAVDRLVAKLRSRNTLLAFDGLEAASQSFSDQGLQAGNGIAKILDYLGSYARSGGTIGLEAAGPLSSEKMQPVGPMLKLVDWLRPDRLVFFPDIIAGWPAAAAQAKQFALAYGPNRYAEVQANAANILRHLQAT